jgi:hypothetical protein
MPPQRNGIEVWALAAPASRQSAAQAAKNELRMIRKFLS